MLSVNIFRLRFYSDRRPFGRISVPCYDGVELIQSDLRERLLNSKTEVYRRGGGSRPDVLGVIFQERKAVYKDQSACDPWFGRVLGPLLAQREQRALRRLGNLQGIPDLLAPVDRYSFVMAWLPGTPVLKAHRQVDWSDFFRRLEALIQQMHHLGIAHGDLRSPGNTLVDDQDCPALVDFVASVGEGHRFNIVKRWFFRRMCEVDKGAILKLKNQLAPELLSVSERRQLAQPLPVIGLLAKNFGKGVRHISRKLFTH